jgi:hypothetical protein
MQIPTARALGASKQGSAGVQIWYVTPHSSHAQPNRTRYSLHKTPALQCQSAEEADRLVAAVRSAACSWASEDRPAEVTALVNPVSGKGRCVQVATGSSNTTSNTGSSAMTRCCMLCVMLSYCRFAARNLHGVCNLCCCQQPLHHHKQQA